MADKGLIAKTTLQAIADAIREKTGETGLMLPSAMAAAIEAISTGANYAFSVTEVIPASETATLSGVAHSLGVSPNVVMAFTDTPLSNMKVMNYCYGLYGHLLTTGNWFCIGARSNNTDGKGSYLALSGAGTVSADENTLTIDTSSGTLRFGAGRRYFVIAAVRTT